MHVTVTCYKQLTVVKEGTIEPPLFIGPIFIHDNSDFDTYCNFFFNLKIKLNDVGTTNLVIGTDDERALVNAIKAAFPPVSTYFVYPTSATKRKPKTDRWRRWQLRQGDDTWQNIWGRWLNACRGYDMLWGKGWGLRVHWAVYLQKFRQVLPEKAEDLDTRQTQ